MKLLEQILRIIDKVKFVDRIVLITAIVSVVISFLLMRILGDNVFALGNGVIFVFVWFSIVGSAWVCLLSTVILVISIIIYRLSNKEIWRSFKREIMLTLGSVASLTMFYLSTMVVK
jgi:hypothetical protein